MFYACEQMDIEAQRCFYVGDTEHDIQAGKNAGMTTVFIDRGHVFVENQTENWLAGFRIAMPLDLLATLRQNPVVIRFQTAWNDVKLHKSVFF